MKSLSDSDLKFDQLKQKKQLSIGPKLRNSLWRIVKNRDGRRIEVHPDARQRLYNFQGGTQHRLVHRAEEKSHSPRCEGIFAANYLDPEVKIVETMGGSGVKYLRI